MHRRSPANRPQCREPRGWTTCVTSPPRTAPSRPSRLTIRLRHICLRGVPQRPGRRLADAVLLRRTPPLGRRMTWLRAAVGARRHRARFHGYRPLRRCDMAAACASSANPAVANARVVCSTVGNVEKTRRTSGKNRSKPTRSVRPGRNSGSGPNRGVDVRSRVHGCPHSSALTSEPAAESRSRLRISTTCDVLCMTVPAIGTVDGRQDTTARSR
jgi:hypothetical protein